MSWSWSGIGDEKISEISCLWESFFPDLGECKRTLRVFIIAKELPTESEVPGY